MTVVHFRREEYDVFCGRPSKWSNPFRIGRDGTRQECIAKYAEWIRTQPDLMECIEELRGKVLGCWCYPLPCHCEVLDRMANATPERYKQETFGPGWPD